MTRAMAGRFRCVAGLAAVLPCAALAQRQRMAPLPPECNVRGSTVKAVVAGHSPTPTSLAVLPLSIGAGAGPFVFLSDGLPNAVANRIGAAVPRIYVVGRRAQRRRAPTTPVEAHALGDELGARYVLAGSISGTRSETQVRLTLFNTNSGKQVWQRTFIYDSTGVLGLEQSTAIEVASHIVAPFSAAEVQGLRRVPTARHAAYEWALRGDAETEDPSRASDAYQHAVQI
jgi:adenylate cyclase